MRILLVTKCLVTLLRPLQLLCKSTLWYRMSFDGYHSSWRSHSCDHIRRPRHSQTHVHRVPRLSLTELTDSLLASEACCTISLCGIVIQSNIWQAIGKNLSRQRSLSLSYQVSITRWYWDTSTRLTLTVCDITPLTEPEDQYHGMYLRSTNNMHWYAIPSPTALYVWLLYIWQSMHVSSVWCLQSLPWSLASGPTATRCILRSSSCLASPSSPRRWRSEIASICA